MPIRGSSFSSHSEVDFEPHSPGVDVPPPLLPDPSLGAHLPNLASPPHHHFSGAVLRASPDPFLWLRETSKGRGFPVGMDLVSPFLCLLQFYLQLFPPDVLGSSLSLR